MSRINKSPNLNEVISMLGASSSSQNQVKEATITRTEHDEIKEKNKAQFKKELSRAIIELDLSEKSQAKNARKILVSKIIDWQLSDSGASVNEISNITDSVQRKLEGNIQAEKILNNLILELQATKKGA